MRQKHCIGGEQPQDGRGVAREPSGSIGVVHGSQRVDLGVIAPPADLSVAGNQQRE
jgi:hypothetical protein